MEAKLQRRVQRYGWDKAAIYYENYWRRQLEPAQTQLLQMAALRPGDQVLDIACGTGLVTVRAAKAVSPTGEVVGTDISNKMMETAAEHARNQGVRNVSFKWADAEGLEFPDRSFDVTLDALGLMYLPDPVSALREMYRLLKPGGRAVAAVWGQRKNCGWADIFPIVDARVQSEVCPLFFQLGGTDILQRLFEEAGFKDVICERLQTTLFYETGEAACGAAFAGGPVALAYSRFTEEMKTGAHAEYLTSIAPFKNGVGYRIPGEFVVVSGGKP